MFDLAWVRIFAGIHINWTHLNLLKYDQRAQKYYVINHHILHLYMLRSTKQHCNPSDHTILDGKLQTMTNTEIINKNKVYIFLKIKNIIHRNTSVNNIHNNDIYTLNELIKQRLVHLQNKTITYVTARANCLMLHVSLLQTCWGQSGGYIHYMQPGVLHLWVSGYRGRVYAQHVLESGLSIGPMCRQV